MSQLYALDFDGVICDSAVETSITAWKACQQLWQDMPETIPVELIDQFRQVRPALETGYEAILIVRLLYKDISADSLLENYTSLLDELKGKEDLDVDQLKQLFGMTRDHWIANNADDWLQMNPLFNGIVEKLDQINTNLCYIITTKQERFVHQILGANDISIPEDQVFGLDRNMNKPQVLTSLQFKHPDHAILFVEDRLPTLVEVNNDSKLSKVRLFLADWGYNTEQDRLAANELPIEQLSLVSLEGFSQL